MASRKGFLRYATIGTLFAAFLTVALHPISTYERAQSLRLLVEGVSSRKVVIDGHQIHYYVRGPVNGSPVVLIHGLGGRAEDWSNLAPFLARAGYRVYTPDLLGFGQSDEPPAENYSIATQAGVVNGFFDAVGLKQADVGGWSMGGWIAQKFAFDHPERVRRLALLDSAGLRMPPDWDTRLFTPANSDDLRQLEALLMPNPPALPEFVAADLLRKSAKSAWVVKRALNSMLRGQDVTDAELPGLKMPVLLLWGAQDQITPLREARAMQALIPDSRLEIVPGCGHLAPDQCAQAFGPRMVQFLDAETLLPPGEQLLQGSI
jgi:pimeloyl-ACP methyl ester carboxylesterase